MMHWESNVNHLGNILNQKLEDGDALRKKKGHFIGSVNKMFSKFENVQSAVLLKLFQRYCCSFYGCTLWKLNKVSHNQLCTAWNKAIMKVWRLPPTAHTCMLGPLNRNLHILDQLVIRFIRFYSRLTSSDNAIVSFTARLAMSNMQIYIRSNILYIKWTYGTDITKTDIHECINFVHQKCQPNVELVSLIGMLNELIDTQDGFKEIPNLGTNEIECFMSISTISLS